MSSDSVYQSIVHLPDQINQVMADVNKINIPVNFMNVANIVISGMGGSIYNYYVINSLFKQHLKIPIYKVNNYEIPSFVNENTLFIASSYSGNTEEVVQTTQEAIRRRAKIITISSGGALGQISKDNNLCNYQFSSNYNPSGQPRLGLGYMIFSPVLILSRLSLLNINVTSFTINIKYLSDNKKNIEAEAKKTIEKLKDNIIILVASDHLSGNVHVFRNQLNETAKCYAEYHLIPELNHHLIEGLKYPEDKKIIFVIYESNLYFVQNIRRILITKTLLEKQIIPCISIHTPSELDHIGQFMYLLQLNSFISYYLSQYYKVDPIAIPWVDFFKKELQSQR